MYVEVANHKGAMNDDNSPIVDPDPAYILTLIIFV